MSAVLLHLPKTQLLGILFSGEYNGHHLRLAVTSKHFPEEKCDQNTNSCFTHVGPL